MGKIKKLLSVILMLCMVLSLVACGSKGGEKDDDKNPSGNTGNQDDTDDGKDDPTDTPTEEPAIDTSEKVDLVFYVMGDAPVDEVLVEEEINKILLEKINATIDFQFSTWTDWAQKYNLELTSGQSDMIYVANWNSYGTLATAGAFLELDELLPTYAPNILATVDEGLLNMCKVDGTLYSIPGTWPEYTVNGIKYREDLRVKYDLPVPNSLENFEAYLLGIKEKDPNQGLLTVTTAESSGLVTAFDAANVFNLKYPWITNNAFPYGLAADYNTPADVYDYWYSEDFVEDMKLMKKWADLGFWSRSALSDPNNDESFKTGLCVAEVAGQNPNKHITAVTDFAKENPDWTSAYLAYGEVTGVLYPASAIQNATAIVRDSENPERALMALDLMFTDQTLNNLVQAGIEGTHYEIDANGYYKNLSENFKYEGFNTWNLRNNDYKLKQESDKLLSEMSAKYAEIGDKTKFPNVNIYSNFTENYDEYQVERAAVSDVMRQYLAPIQAGLVDDVEAEIAKFLEKAEAAGLTTCRDAFKEQWAAYCEEYGYK
ncbi:MAG: transporter substrate-binding protein [Herbinix sp.]|jgi:putative aldouronate transport system substrate-binding protein|nr:transporter substrate-binding protein [Herbinix sp.]